MGDGWFVQDFKNDHVVGKFAHFGCHLIPQGEEVGLFFFVFYGIVFAFCAVCFCSTATGAVEFYVMVEVYDNGKSISDGEPDVFFDAL